MTRAARLRIPHHAPSLQRGRSSWKRRCARTAGHSLSMIENTTVSRFAPSGISWWLRSTPSCLAPSRAIAARDAWLNQCVRNSTAMQREHVERVREQHQLALGVDRRALRALRVPRVADLDAAVRRVDVEEPRAADDVARRGVAHDEGHRVVPLAHVERGRHVARPSGPAARPTCTRAATARRPQPPARAPARARPRAARASRSGRAA